MKTIAAPAMAAIEAGTAIVTGAVEILPVSTLIYDYELVTTVDIDAVTNAGWLLSDAPTVGITVSGFSAADVLRLTLPTGELFTAWFYGPSGSRWVNEFDIVPDGVTANSFRVSQAGITPSSGAHSPGGYSSAELARAAFGTHFITGATAYTFWIFDAAPGGGGPGNGDNTDGVSVRIEKQVIASGAPADPIRVWGGYGPIEIDGEVFEGIGARGLAQQTAGAVGGVAQGMTLSLSGIEPGVLALLEASEIKRASAVIYRLIFAGDGKTLLDAQVFDRGRVDTIDTAEEIGGVAEIRVAVESAARGLGRAGARRRSDSDQRLIDPDDGYFKHTAYAGQKTLYWGGKKPRHAGS